MTLYQALTQRFPYGEIERFQTPRFRTPKRAMQLNPHLPGWLDAVLMRALSPTPEDRYASFSELRFDLDHPGSVEPFRLAAPDSLRALVFYRAAFFILLAIIVFYLAYHFFIRT